MNPPSRTYRARKVTPQDNVATVIDDVPAGGRVQIAGDTLVTTEDIPYGHKVALQPIEKGAAIVKYGESIGVAGMSIQRGALVHVHNVVSQRGRGDLQEATDV